MAGNMSLAKPGYDRRCSLIMWLTVSFFYAFQYILRVLPGILMDDVMVRFSMDAMLFGQFSGTYYIGYALAHLPIGIMLDRCGPKKIVPTCVLLSVIGILPLIFAAHWTWPILGRMFTGIGSSAAILGVFKVIRLAFEERRFARMLSISTSIGLMGAIYGGAPVRQLHASFGYASIVMGLAIMGIVLAILCHVTIPATIDSKEHMEGNRNVFSALVKILTNSKVVLLCLSAGLMVGPLEGFADSWGPKFLNRVHGIDLTHASFLSSLIFVGMCFGSPVLSFIAEKSRHYFDTIIISGILMLAVLTSIAVCVAIPRLIIVAGFLIVGLCSSYQILVIYKISMLVGKEMVGLATALANMIIMIFGYAFHGAIGSTIKICSRFGEEFSLRCGIAVIPLALLLGCLGSYWVRKMAKEI
ncbi:MAG: MFS transporter [Puniceicoccales bacterium]|jgi:predicted MFS family arabinose efflux permease|nr:MFS transporter [Puniceicoccales bacterium]